MRRRAAFATVVLGAMAVWAPGATAAGVMDNACPPDRVPPAFFYDTYENTHEAAIDCVAWYGVATGVAANTYAPAGQVRRDQMASFMARSVRAMRGSLPAPGTRFDDVSGNAHRDAIESLAAAGIVSGTGTRTYSPGAVVPRGQMATFLVRTYEHLTGSVLTSDQDFFDDDAGSPHEANINKAAQAGFTGGTGPRQFSPSNPVRRDQMASFVARMLGLAVDRAPGGRLKPYPLGTAVQLVDEWRMQVVSSDPDADAEIAAENQFNDPPEAGRQFFMVRVRATWAGSGSSRFEGSYRLRALGAASGVTYSTFEDSCGVIPDELEDPEVFSGGTIEGNVCFSVREQDVSGLTVFDDEQERPSRPYFATT